MPDQSKSIWERKLEIQKAQRQAIKLALIPFEEQLQALQNECKETTGHNLKFSHVGPVGGLWFYCNSCGASEFKKDE